MKHSILVVLYFLTTPPHSKNFKRLGATNLDDFGVLTLILRSPNAHPYSFGWWFGTFFIFPYIGNVIIPTDFHIFSEG